MLVLSKGWCSMNVCRNHIAPSVCWLCSNAWGSFWNVDLRIHPKTGGANSHKREWVRSGPGLSMLNRHSLFAPTQPGWSASSLRCKPCYGRSLSWRKRVNNFLVKRSCWRNFDASLSSLREKGRRILISLSDIYIYICILYIYMKET